MSVRQAHHRGFTLVELLASMAIGSIILLTAASLLGGGGDGYERVGGGVATEREARALMTQLASDLSTARFHKDCIFEKSSAKWRVDRLGFLSLQPAEAQSEANHIGDLCAVNYYIKDETVNGRTTRCLMRGFRESKESFAALKDGNVSSLFAERKDGGAAMNADEPVAFGVLSFEVNPKKRDEAGQWIDWVVNDETGPEALDVRLVVVRRNVAGRLKQSSDWDGGGSGTTLGQPSAVERNKDLEIFSALMRFGNDENH